jgi:hypothetical protein
MTQVKRVLIIGTLIAVVVVAASTMITKPVYAVFTPHPNYWISQAEQAAIQGRAAVAAAEGDTEALRALQQELVGSGNIGFGNSGNGIIGLEHHIKPPVP